MIFGATPIAGVMTIELEPFVDERGFFARTFCVDEMRKNGLDPHVAQESVSYNRRAGTLRGIHFQAAPHEEQKIVSCARGRIWDVAVDLREASPSYRQWFAVELGSEGRALCIPPGVGHGFLTLADDTVVEYRMNKPYAPGSGRGLRFDDPSLDIRWPFPPTVISAADQGLPHLPA